MKAWLTTLCLMLPSLAGGHIGSPNVFFEGQAGAHPVRVIIRPPAVLPGVAQVDVRVGTNGVRNVRVQAALWETSMDAAPPPLLAVRVAGETNLFNASPQLMWTGAYSIQVTVEGQFGSGSVTIPINSVATATPEMSARLQLTLIALGALLFAGAAFLAGATARDGTLAPGVVPTDQRNGRAWKVTVAAAVVLLAGIAAGKARWQKMDREFRNNALAKPVPVNVDVRTNGSLRLLHLSASARNTGGPGWDSLLADHGKLMHLFLLRENDLNAFAHLHPVRRDSQNFENVLPPLPGGDYQLYAEVTYENGLSETLVGKVSLPEKPGRAPQLAGSSNMLDEVYCESPIAPIGNSPQPFALDADDSWHTGATLARHSSRMKTSQLMGGGHLVFQHEGELVENRETSLRFAAFARDGSPMNLQPYMGMLGHAVVRRNDGEVFTHLHPVGTISMAAEAILARVERGENGGSETNSISPMPVIRAANPSVNEVSFPYAFPRSGEYRVWVQVRIDGRVMTGVFDVQVKARG